MKRVQKLDQTGTVRLCALAAGAIFEWVKIIEFLIAFHIHTDRHTHTHYIIQRWYKLLFRKNTHNQTIQT